MTPGIPTTMTPGIPTTFKSVSSTEGMVNFPAVAAQSSTIAEPISMPQRHSSACSVAGAPGVGTSRSSSPVRVTGTRHGASMGSIASASSVGASSPYAPLPCNRVEISSLHSRTLSPFPGQSVSTYGSTATTQPAMTQASTVVRFRSAAAPSVGTLLPTVPLGTSGRPLGSVANQTLAATAAAAAFNTIDRNHDGMISRSEFNAALGSAVRRDGPALTTVPVPGASALSR